jgi:CubicO group peptidase (beta-lactamase class C family)
MCWHAVNLPLNLITLLACAIAAHAQSLPQPVIEHAARAVAQTNIGTTESLSTPESEGEIERAEISEIVRKHFPADSKGAVAVLVTRDGRVLHRKGHGREGDLPITSDTPLQLASITKQFAAMCAAFFIDEGRLKTTDKVSTHLPGVNLSVNGRELLVQDLLWHTSGLANFLERESQVSIGAYKKAHGLERMTNQTHADWLATMPLRRAPGVKYEYTNSGYVLLARIVEVLAGKPFHEFQKERIFDVLGMNQASDSVTFNGSGNMFVSLRDYEKWDRALWNGSLVKPETWKLMVQSGRLDNGEPVGYGFGWKVTWEDGELVEMKHGGIGAPPANSRNEILRDIRQRITVAFFSREKPGITDDLKREVARELRDCAKGLK